MPCCRTAANSTDFYLLCMMQHIVQLIIIWCRYRVRVYFFHLVIIIVLSPVCLNSPMTSCVIVYAKLLLFAVVKPRASL